MIEIVSMTATFGKLNNETLTFSQGVNILEAPNEWGKSTWCAFLTAMFYGIDTRSRSTKDALSDKEHYTPWSGKPMAGRMTVRTEKGDMVLERSQKGRIPFGEFRAYWVESGAVVSGLTGENCGKTLLGVEREVFVRTSLLRQWDLPVEDHAALRSRLQNLVTTGEETGDDLLRKLREAKNRISYRGGGMLPQSYAELARIDRIEAAEKGLEEKIETLQREIEGTKQEESLLKNHIEALKYQAYQKKQENIQKAVAELDSRYEAWQRAKEQKENRKKRFPFWILAVGLAIAFLALGKNLFAGISVCFGAALYVLLRPKQEPDWEEEAQKDYEAQAQLVDALQQNAPPTPKPKERDDCSLFLAETEKRLAELPEIRARKLRLLGQLEGRRQPIPNRKPVEAEIERLQKMEQALSYALETANRAKQELQSRFAPGITKRTGELFRELTAGAYSSLTIGEDLQLLVSPVGETVERTPLWCSSGTADALYFALRLALSEAVCPGVPLILDDAFVRFDDTRLKAALSLLQKCGVQVILFTCQGREKTAGI